MDTAETFRPRSFWGWGYEDRFPDQEARRALAGIVVHRLGCQPPALLPVPVLAAIRLEPARIAAPPHLAAWVTDDREARVRHTYGRAYPDLVRGFSGDFATAPDLVAFPRDEADVERLLAWAAACGVAVVPYGGGTSVVGGVEYTRRDRHPGVVSLDLRLLGRVLEIDADSRAVHVQGGAMGPELENQLAAHAVTLRHYPQSFEFSTVGGWLATRAGGHFATLYTHIDDAVESVRMITPTGVFESRRVPASGAGPDPNRMVLGSEGALGVITAAWLRLHRRPQWRATASVHFAEFDGAVDAVQHIAQSGLYPSNCRLLDASEALLNGVALDGHHVLLLAFESSDHDVTPWIARALEIAVAHDARCVAGPNVRTEATTTEDGGREARTQAWRDAFLNAPYVQSALVSMGIIADTFETACTWSRFATLHRGIRESVEGAMRRACGAGQLSCRFTHVYPDGPAPYYTFVAPGQPGREIEQWGEIKRAASDAILAHGGTITHHHAVGRTHRPWYDRERPDVFADALRAVKSAWDPEWILNPGVLVDPSP